LDSYLVVLGRTRPALGSLGWLLLPGSGRLTPNAVIGTSR